VVAACSPSTTTITPSPSTTPRATSRATATPSATPITDPLSTCPASASFASLPVFARITSADDLAAAPDGTLWVSTATGNVIVRLTAGGSVLTRITDPQTPEGLVVLADGRLYVGDQNTDRVVVLQPPTYTATTLLQLTLPSGGAGVDGLGVDLPGGRLLVPDSAQGQLFVVPLTGGAATKLASGMGRVVGAAVAPDGSIAVSAEARVGLLQVPSSGGAASPIDGIVQADDVVSSGWLLYVTALTAHEVIAVDPSTGRTQVLVTNVTTPQGLTLMAGNRLAVSDFTSGTISAFPAC
jgi:streptogramin lyase